MEIVWLYILTILMPINFLITWRGIKERKRNYKLLMHMWRFNRHIK